MATERTEVLTKREMRRQHWMFNNAMVSADTSGTGSTDDPPDSREDGTVYGQVAGAGVAAGVPAALAFTGITSTGFAAMLGVAALLIVTGVLTLRAAHRRS